MLLSCTKLPFALLVFITELNLYQNLIFEIILVHSYVMFNFNNLIFKKKLKIQAREINYRFDTL